MKKLFTLIIISFLFVQMGWSQSQKTFVKSLALESATILADLEGKVTISEWDKDIVRITATVDVQNFNEDILKRLFSVGRYNIESELKNGVMVITMPKLSTKVTIRGQELLEEVSYEISVPEGTKIKVKDNTTVSVNQAGI